MQELLFVENRLHTMKRKLEIIGEGRQTASLLVNSPGNLGKEYQS